MIDVQQTGAFARWLNGLRDRGAKIKILGRVARMANGDPGDVEPVGARVSELRIHFGPGYRVYFVQRGLSVERHQSGQSPGSPIGAFTMTVELTRFDPADYLDDEEDMAAYLAECAEDGDPALIAQALGAIARARNMSQLARDTGMTRAGLSRALAPDGNPSFKTVSKVAKALGLKISITPAETSAPPMARISPRRARRPLAPRKTLPRGCMNGTGGDPPCSRNAAPTPRLAWT